MLCTGFIFINTQLLHRISINSIAIKFRVDALMLPVRYSYQTSCCIDASILLSASVIIFTYIILFPYMLVLNACLVLLCLPCVLPSFFFFFFFCVHFLRCTIFLNFTAFEETVTIIVLFDGDTDGEFITQLYFQTIYKR